MKQAAIIIALGATMFFLGGCTSQGGDLAELNELNALIDRTKLKSATSLEDYLECLNENLLEVDQEELCKDYYNSSEYDTELLMNKLYPRQIELEEKLGL